MYVCMYVFLDHPYYVGVQYHPEYLSRPLSPSPPYLGLILASCGKLQSYLDHGCSFASTNGHRSNDFPMFDSDDLLLHDENFVSVDHDKVPNKTDYSKVNGVA